VPRATAKRERNTEAAQPRGERTRKRRTASLSFEDVVGYNLRRAYAVQTQRFVATFSPFSIRPVQFSILGLIYENPGLRQAELGRMLNIKRANVVTLLDELEARDILRRRTDATDRRSYVLELTPSGSRLAVTLLDLHARLEKDMASSLGQREHAELLRLLKKFRRLDPHPNLDVGGGA
jgi:DNA-binding MarR family transcriptional regulator